MSLNRLNLCVGFFFVLLAAHCRNAAADEQHILPVTDASFQKSVAPLLQTYCQDCHRPDLAEADVDLTNLRSLDDLRGKIDTWVRVRAMLDSHQMPPNDALQPKDAERETLQTWVRRFLTQEARAMAGDPGPVVLRRLSNAEYTYTIQDLTGVANLNPAAEFPLARQAGHLHSPSGWAKQSTRLHGGPHRRRVRQNRPSRSRFQALVHPDSTCQGCGRICGSVRAEGRCRPAGTTPRNRSCLGPAIAGRIHCPHRSERECRTRSISRIFNPFQKLPSAYVFSRSRFCSATVLRSTIEGVSHSPAT